MSSGKVMKLRITQPLKRSYWQDSIGPSVPCPPLVGNQEADVAIVGGGFVGLWTALTIKQHEPDCRVVLLGRVVNLGDSAGYGALVQAVGDLELTDAPLRPS